jgi:hypothetical protein
VAFSRWTIQATVSHSVFLNKHDVENCEGGIINFTNGKTLGGQGAQGLYEITLREEFAKVNK